MAITDNATNPLACACDYTLLSPVKGVAIDYTNAATIAMINVIVNCLAEEIRKRYRRNWKRTRDSGRTKTSSACDR